jgi:hypothetical protein
LATTKYRRTAHHLPEKDTHPAAYDGQAPAGSLAGQLDRPSPPWFWWFAGRGLAGSGLA